ncbi:hypothetical protein OF83DRAFT_1103752 [Amylostereum chailletii]|nr:hypothetical protein OF83DRAFT_1103752 [Amylostereum chailletii]
MLRASVRALTRPLGVPTRISPTFSLQTASMASRTRLDARSAELAREAVDDVEDATAVILESQPPPGPSPSESYHGMFAIVVTLISFNQGLLQFYRVTLANARVLMTARRGISSFVLIPLFVTCAYSPFQFVKPSDLRDRSNEPPLMGRKRALLGPGASESKAQDWFYQLGIDPLYEATNPRLLSFFVSEMGKVKSRAITKLTWRSQRRLTKAIRRAKMMGVMPILHRHMSREGI